MGESPAVEEPRAKPDAPSRLLPGERPCPASEVSKSLLYPREPLPVVSVPVFVLRRWKYWQRFWEGQGLGKDVPIYHDRPPNRGLDAPLETLGLNWKIHPTAPMKWDGFFQPTDKFI